MKKSLGNLTLLIMKATKLNKVLMIRRYIEYILLILESNKVSIEIIENLKNTFKEYDLYLTSTIMSTESGVDGLPFSDIELILVEANEKSFFNTKNLKKLQL